MILINVSKSIPHAPAFLDNYPHLVFKAFLLPIELSTFAAEWHVASTSFVRDKVFVACRATASS